MRKILLTYCSFVIACLVVIVAFMTATTYVQLTVAILLYPLLVYFAYRVFPRKIPQNSKKSEDTTQSSETTIQPPVESVEKVEPAKTGILDIADIDKRLFLKLIGGAGLTLFLFSIFNKKGESLFFKSLPASGSVSLQDINGKKIDPAQNHPTDGYKISDISDTDNFTFYGYINKDGGWYIMRGGADDGSYRYVAGDTNFPNNWTNRENLKYDYFNSVF